MGSDNLLAGNASFPFQRVDVLSEASQQKPLAFEQLDEIMGSRWFEVPRIQLFGKHVEWCWIPPEEANFKDGGGSWEVVLL